MLYVSIIANNGVGVLKWCLSSHILSIAYYLDVDMLMISLNGRSKSYIPIGRGVQGPSHNLQPPMDEGVSE
jgi:hypothetical protein